MKRIVTWLAIIFVLFALPAFADSSFPGVWIETEGYGTLTLFDDGTAIMEYYDGTITENPWMLTDEGAKFTEGQWYNSPMVLLDDNTLSVADGWMIFAREGFLPTTDEALLLGAEPVGEAGYHFCGTWALEAIISDGETFDPATIGISLELTLSSNGLATSYDGVDVYTTTWFESYGNAVVEGDVLVLDNDGKLVMEDADGQMIFTLIEAEFAAQEALAEEITEPVSPFIPDVNASTEELSEEEQLLALLTLMLQMAESDDKTGFDYLNTKFVCTSYSASGVTLDSSTLGAEFGVYFREDSTADLILAGYVMEDLPYSITDEGVYAVNYYGTFFNCTPTGTGFDLDYYGTMTMHCTPVE